MRFTFRYILLFLCSLVAGGVMTSCHTSKSVKKTRYEKRHKKSNSTYDNKKHHIPSSSYHLDKIKVNKGNKTQKRIVEEAMTWLGTPYKYAGNEKGVGTDCSGLVLEVYRKIAGKDLPRNSAKQAEFCESLKENQLTEGDLVFFATGKDPDKISHVGIIIDEDSFVHASTSKGVVVSTFSNDYYRRTFKKFGKVE